MEDRSWPRRRDRAARPEGTAQRLHPSRESVADAEIGLYGTQIQGEIAEARNGPDQNPEQESRDKGLSLGELHEDAQRRRDDDRGRGDDRGASFWGRPAMKRWNVFAGVLCMLAAAPAGL